MARHHAALVASCVGIASAPALIRLSEVDPATTLWLRMVLASVILIGARQWRRIEDDRPLSGSTLCCVLAASVAFALDLLAFHLAVARTSVANAALLGNIAPLVVAPLAYLLLDERQTLRAVIGLGVGIAGAILLVGAGEGRIGGTTSVIGDALAALSGVLYALYILVCRRIAGRVSADRLMFCSCLVAAIVLAPLVAHDGEIRVPHSAAGWLVIAAMALGCQILGHGLLVYALAGMPASFASITLLAAPVISAAIAWLLFQESLTVAQWIGGALVLAGLGAASLPTYRTP